MPARDLGSFGRFLANGLAATAVHYAVLVALIEVAGLQSAGLANGFAAVVGIAVSYLGNRLFVFRSDRSVLTTLPAFLGVYAAIALLHAGFLTVWSDRWFYPYTWGFVLATAAATVLSFAANRLIIFR